MKKFFGNKPILIMVIAVVLLLVLAFFSAGSRTIPWVESTVGSIISPIQTFAFRASNSISDFFRGLFNTTDADLENASLKQMLALYEQEKLEEFECSSCGGKIVTKSFYASARCPYCKHYVIIPSDLDDA